MPEITITEIATIIGAIALLIPTAALLQYRQYRQEESNKDFRSIVEKLSAGKKGERIASASSLGTFIKKGGKFYDESIDVLVNTVSMELDYNVLNAIRGSLEKTEKKDYIYVIEKLLAIDRNFFVYEYPIKSWANIIKKDIEKVKEASSKEEYLFSWDKIPGNDNWKLIEFLRQNFNIDWVETAKIEKIDDDKTIRVSSEKNFLIIELNDEKTRVNILIDDDRTDNFIVKAENDELHIYKEDASKVNKVIFNNLEKEIIQKQEMCSKFEKDLNELKFNDEFVKNFIASFLMAVNPPIKNLKFYRNSMDFVVLSDIELTRSEILLSSFSQTVINGTIFNNATIVNSVFSYSSFEKSKFVNCKIESSLFDYVTFKDVDFSGSEFKDVFFVGADLTGVNFKDAKGLEVIYFYKADTSKAEFDDDFKKKLNETNITELEFKEYIISKSELPQQRRKEIISIMEAFK